MRRVTIAGLMFAVALVAANFAALRFLLRPSAMQLFLWMLLAGLLPLVDALVVSAFFVAARYRVVVVRRNPADRGRFAPGFAAACAALLVASIAVCLCVPESYETYPLWAAQPADHYFRWIGINSNVETPLLRYVIRPAFLGLFLSGPPLVMALATGVVLSQFTVAFSRRDGRRGSP